MNSLTQRGYGYIPQGVLGVRLGAQGAASLLPANSQGSVSFEGETAWDVPEICLASTLKLELDCKLYLP